MSAVLLIVIVAAVGVSAALVRLMTDDSPVPSLPARKPAEPAAEPVRTAPAPLPRALTHWARCQG
jgi:hypothetical protein